MCFFAGAYAKKAKDDGGDEKEEECVFGADCYRRNPHHFKNYGHSHLLALCLAFPEGKVPKEKLGAFGGSADVIAEQLPVFKDVCKEAILKERKKSSSPEAKQKNGTTTADKKPESSGSQPATKKSNIQRKLEEAAPVSFFLTKVEDSPETHSASDSLYFADLIHPSIGKIKRSLQINFMVEWDWLWMNYEVTKNQDKELLILYGEDNPDLHPSKLPPNVQAVCVKPRFPFGKHHTKMSVMQYEDDSVRVVVSTANLVSSDWRNRTQGLWVSPRCPPLKASAQTSDSQTGFKDSLLKYLRFYGVSRLRPYIEAVERCDFSSVNVFLVASVPDSHRGPAFHQWGHRRLAQLLRRHLLAQVGERWPVVAQCSSIGSLGHNPDAWMRKEIGRALECSKTVPVASVRRPPMSVIYPSKKDVMGSYDSIAGGGCLPYSMKTHQKQPWLEEFLHHWRCSSRDRNRAMPHIKTYTRLDPEGRRAAFLLLTSANLSKAAWGTVNKAGDSMQIQSYEAGVLFLPQFVFGEKDKDTFELGKDLRLPYDLPLTKYSSGDSVWFMDYLRAAME